MDGMVESYVCVYILITNYIFICYIFYIYTHLQSYYAEIPPFFWGGVQNHRSLWCEFHLQTLLFSALSGRAGAVLNHHFQNLDFSSSATRSANGQPKQPREALCKRASNMAHFFLPLDDSDGQHLCVGSDWGVPPRGANHSRRSRSLIL